MAQQYWLQLRARSNIDSKKGKARKETWYEMPVKESESLKSEQLGGNKDDSKKLYYASGMALVEGRWQSCGWQIEAESFTEAARIAEADETFRLHSLKDNVAY